MTELIMRIISVGPETDCGPNGGSTNTVEGERGRENTGNPVGDVDVAVVTGKTPAHFTAIYIII